MEPPQTRQSNRKQARKILADIGIMLLPAAIALATWHVVAPRSSPINYFLTADALPAVPRPRRLPTLPPSLFSGRVAEGYRIAQQRPELLEQLPCYCGCYLTHGHQNNLDCFRDRHGEECDMCLEIAVRAERMEQKGYAAEDIKKVIDRQFAPRKL